MIFKGKKNNWCLKEIQAFSFENIYDILTITYLSNKTMSGVQRESEGTRITFIPP